MATTPIIPVDVANKSLKKKNSRRSNQRPPVLKSATLPTELWGSALIYHGEIISSPSCKSVARIVRGLLHILFLHVLD